MACDATGNVWTVDQTIQVGKHAGTQAGRHTLAHARGLKYACALHALTPERPSNPRRSLGRMASSAAFAARLAWERLVRLQLRRVSEEGWNNFVEWVRGSLWTIYVRCAIRLAPREGTLVPRRLAVAEHW